MGQAAHRNQSFGSEVAQKRRGIEWRGIVRESPVIALLCKKATGGQVDLYKLKSGLKVKNPLGDEGVELVHAPRWQN